MGLSKKILNLALKFIDLCTFWIKPDPARITFISLTQDHLDSDFALIYEQLQALNRYDLHTNLMVFRKGIRSKAHYFLNCLRQLVEFKKSALVILNDNNYVACHFKPEKTKVLQVWHAAGAIKKFGNQIRRQYPIKGYDRILTSSPFWTRPYAEAFGAEADAMVQTGLPRIDLLLDKKRTELARKAFFEKYPHLKNRRLILYAPTFRGNIIDGLKADSFDMARVLDALGEDTFILYKFHPLLPKQPSSHPRAIDVSDQDLYTLMQISDGMISDYSSVILDYSLLDKPLYAYLDDLQEYQESIGLNIDYLKEFPGDICTGEEQLIQALLASKDDREKRKAFQEKYIVNKDGRNTQRVIEVIESVMN